MKSIATNHITFPDRFNPLTERRTTAQSWRNALKPFFRFVNITPSEENGMSSWVSWPTTVRTSSSP